MKRRIKSGELVKIHPNCHPGLDPGSKDMARVLDSRFRGNDQEESVFELEANAHLELTQVTLVEQDCQQHFEIIFLGEHASCSLKFLDFAKQNAKLKTVVNVFHQAPNCRSEQLHKGLYADEACGILKAYVEVPHGALGTDASQLHRSLLLSPSARVQAEPHLKIDADAVKCKHGASIGQLDEQALFYLRARGLNEQEARRWLIRGFAAEILTGFSEFEEQVFAWI